MDAADVELNDTQAKDLASMLYPLIIKWYANKNNTSEEVVFNDSSYDERGENRMVENTASRR